MQRRVYYLLFGLILFLAYGCGEEPTAPDLSPSDEATPLAKKASEEEGDPAILALMHDINDQLAAQGLNIAIEEIVFFTIGQGRPSNRIHQQSFRWVPNDSRRAAQGIDITHIVDKTFQGTSSGVSALATEAEIDASMTTWDTEKALKKVSVVKRADPGVDISIFDEFFPAALPFGDVNPDEPASGFPFAGDIVNVGWYPRGFFEAVGGPGGGDGILAFSVTFIFTGPDINGDNYLDTALNEVYYNDTFGKPGDPRAGFPWSIGQMALPGIDVQTVAFHENGHSLGIGHFGFPPAAALNPFYSGPQITPLPPDQAGMAAVWRSWPNP